MKARSYDKQITIDADALEPMITYGTNPGMGIRSIDRVPDPSPISDPLERDSVAKALRYMGLEAGKPLVGPCRQCGLHRKLHQFAHLRSAQRRALYSRAAK